jgi:UDP-N-acetyl-D-galactosamine dehydrogenase
MIFRKVSVIGLGYVGLPVAVEFGKTQQVIGFDINQTRIEELSKGLDRNLEVDKDELISTNILYSSNFEDLKTADFHIVTVPTPVSDGNIPDLSIVYKASETVGKALKKGDIVVYESTVYPGVTEEECVPILERVSGLKFGKDFTVGYSPERINPGDKNHTFTKIKKVVSGSDSNTLNIVAEVYGSVVTAGTFKAASIKVAEAAKVIENSQRDINIAFMNELAMIFEKMDISTSDVLSAASTKWNFLNFYPGLVGGHCIGVDPYYLTHRAETLGYHPQVILSGRRINDGMGEYVANKLVKTMILKGLDVSKSTVTVMGLTFKENTPDIRNSKIADIIKELKGFGIDVQVTDPLAMADEVKHEYGINLVSLENLKPADAILLAVGHNHYKELSAKSIQLMLKNEKSVVIGIRSHLKKADFDNLKLESWFL